ncbi:MAG: ATP-binding cassette domain-containing protein [Phycisphaerae bacterium]|nr:ATP-binding cassette domain-containing protein [Phycisphaerae bacterium]
MPPVARAETILQPFAIVAHGVSRRFGDVEAVRDVALQVDAGSFVALIGPSGCGKTTLLRMLAGVDQPESGRVEYLDARGPIAAAVALRGISFCFQEPRLLPWRDVVGNVELPLELDGVPIGERRERAMAAIRRMGLDDAATRRPHQLSGGMRMRAAMARAIVTRPRLMLLDEPFGALDDVTRQELDDELHQLWVEDRFTAVLVTHSITEAVFLSTRAVVFSPRPARILLERTIELAAHDAAVRVSDEFNAYVRVLSLALQRGIRESRA